MMSYINETDFVIENKELVYPEIVTDGLQLYYDAKGKRDTDYHRDTMLDMSGNKNHGKLHNFAYEKHSGYKDGLVFDYIDDKLVRPALNLQPNDFTFMLNGNIISFSPDGTVKRVQDGEVIESKGVNLNRAGKQIELEGYAIGHNMWHPGYNFNLKSGHHYYTYRKLSPISTNAGAYGRLTNLQGITLIDYTHSLSNITIPTSDYNGGFTMYGHTTKSKTKWLDLTIIDLTETFGAGKEPTKEEMDEIINQFGFIPNAQDLINRIEYKGNDLGDMENIIDGLYKTEILSGEEIYTDEADDAVVHVEIDGKSYQHAGNGKNMFNKYLLSDRSKFKLGTYSASPVIQLKPNTGYIISASRVNPSPDGNQLVLYVMDATDGTPMWGDSDYNDKRIRAIFNMVASHAGFDSFRATFTTPASGLIYFSYYDMNYGESSEGNWFTDVMIDAQLEEGSIATEYEPPVQSPEYPIEIKSLNDFDVVSSVGKENLIENRFLQSYLTTTGPIEWRNTKVVEAIMYSYSTEVSPYYPAGQYTFSADIKIAENDPQVAAIRVSGAPEGSSFSTIAYVGRYDTIGSKWTRVSYTFNLTEPSQIGLQMYPHSFGDEYASYVAIRNIKLERGRETNFNPSNKDIAELSNHPYIDKINLLLDEPLRSVGDVKDRLFRDNDGLWKIERKVWAQVLDKNTVLNSSGAASYEGTLSTNRYISPSKSSLGYGTSTHELCTHLPHKDQVWTNDDLLFGTSVNGPTQYHFRLPNDITGVIVGDSIGTRTRKISAWLESEKNNGNPFIVQYKLKDPEIEILDQSLQDKLNNLRSFEDSNYIYTVLPEVNNILSNNIKPTLHAKFLYNNWYKEDRVINNLMIYNRALSNEEMLKNYKTIKRRWGM